MSDDNRRGNVFNVSSHGQIGGITAGQVIVGAPQRQLEDPTEDELERMRRKPDSQVMFGGYLADRDTNRLARSLSAVLQQVCSWDIYGVMTALTPPKGEIEIWTKGDGGAADPMGALAEWLQRTGFHVVFHTNAGNQIMVGPAR